MIIGVHKILIASGVTVACFFIEGTPNDVFTDAPLHYKSSPEGFDVYSAGANLRDDGGARVYRADDVAFRYLDKGPRNLGGDIVR